MFAPSISQVGSPVSTEGAACTSRDELREQLQTALGDTYVVERELGGGGMSHVFVAQDARRGQRRVRDAADARFLRCRRACMFAASFP